MKSAFTSVKITPPIGVPLAGNGYEDSHSRGIHDDLYANMAYFESGSGRHLFIATDLLGLKRTETDDIKSRIKAATGLPEHSVTVTATHTHSGPNTLQIFKTFLDENDMRLCRSYLAWLTDVIVQAVPELIGSAEQSLYGFGSGDVGGFSFNRRIVLKNGTLAMVFEEYDPADIVRLAGPNGYPVMNVFLAADMSGSAKGAIINYTSHPAVVCGQDWLYSRDYIHYLTMALQDKYGPGFTVLFINGAQGNMVAADPYKRFVTGFEEAERVGRGLAAGAIGIIDKMLSERAFQTDINIRAVTAELPLPLRMISEDDRRKAEDVLARPKTGAVYQHGLDPRVEAESITEMAAITDTAYTTVIQAVLLGETVVITFPGEVFIECALSVMQGIPKKTAVFGLANDYAGYIPTAAAFTEGGYEIKPSAVSSRFAPEADGYLIDACLKLAGELLK